MTNQEMQAELAKLKAENEALKAAKVAGISYKVGESGAISVYGMGRFPVSLHKNQWLTVFTIQEDLKAFIAKSEGEITAKNEANKAKKDAERAAAKLVASGGVTASDFETVMVNGKPTVQRKA